MKIKESIYLGILFLVVACSQLRKPEGIDIEGEFQNASGKKLYFSELEVDGIINLDSIILDDKGKFKFRYKPSDAGFYLLKSVTGEKILLLLEKDESVKVFSNFDKVPFSYEVSGSPGSLLLKEYFFQTSVNLCKADSLTSILIKLKGTPEFFQRSIAFDTLFNKIINDQKTVEKTFISKNKNSLASLIVLNYTFGMLPVLKEDEDFNLYLLLDSTLTKSYPFNKHVLFLHKRVAEHQRQQALQKLREEENKKKY